MPSAVTAASDSAGIGTTFALAFVSSTTGFFAAAGAGSPSPVLVSEAAIFSIASSSAFSEPSVFTLIAPDEPPVARSVISPDKMYTSPILISLQRRI
jgi:hypothetical protein